MILSRSMIVVAAVAMALSGCARKGPDGGPVLTRIKNTSEGPDEFAILPTKPLQAPESFNALPTPTPGSANLVDPNPEAEGIAALGGNPAAINPTAPSAADGALLNAAGRYGIQGGIRQTLAQEDAEVRKRHGRVNILNIGPNDDYTNAYRRQWLNSQAEQERLRRIGVTVPAAPPAE